MNDVIILLQTACGADWLPPPEQSDGVLVHGGLCSPQLPRHQDRVQQHVRASNHQRPVSGQHALRRQADEISGSRTSQLTGGIRTKVSIDGNSFGDIYKK